MARVIAIANQKGGVGKTTTAVNLGASLAASEQHTLIIDSDPQGNATSALGFAKDPSRRTLYQALILGEPIERVTIDAQIDRPRSDSFRQESRWRRSRADFHGQSRIPPEGSHRAAPREKYDFILIDCPPSLDILTVNALAASDSVLVPVQCEFLALEGVSELLDTLARLRRSINPSLAIEGILLTMYDDRTTLSKQVAADLRSFFGAQVFESVIPRNVRLAEAPSHGMPVMFYDIHSRGAESYIQLAKEVIVNAQKRVGPGPERTDQGTGTPAASAPQPPVAAGGAAAAVAPALAPSDAFLQIDIDLIDPSPFQPRTRFREEALEELARSIRVSGIVQPLVVRRVGQRFQLIAGERRWRAAQRSAFSRVPAIVRDVRDEMALEMTLVENLQREDLNPVEQARAFQRLTDEFHLTQEEVAERTGKDRATIANSVRLLRLEEPILDLLEEGRLSAGHGRALLSIAEPKDRLDLARKIARGGMTVRQVERLAARSSKAKADSAGHCARSQHKMGHRGAAAEIRHQDRAASAAARAGPAS